MAFPTDTYLQFIRNAAGWVSQEFESFYAQLAGYLSVQHKEDGSHGAITGDSLTLTADSVTGATGDVDADGDGTFGGNVVALAGSDDALTGRCELGIQSVIPSFLGESGLLLGGTSHGWFVQVRAAASPGTGSDKELRFWDLDNSTSVSVLRLVRDASNSRWLLGLETGGALAIGENSAGKRIAFLAATAINLAGGTDLTHYSEGTWTPVVTFVGGTTGITYTQQIGTYTRIGNQVTVSATIRLSSKGSSTGFMTIAGLPFTVKTGAIHASVSVGYFDQVALPGTSDVVCGYASSNTTTLVIMYGTTTGVVQMADTHVNNTLGLVLTSTYFV